VVVDREGNVIDENCTTCGTRYVQTGPAFGACYRSITVDSSFVTVSVPLLSCGTTSVNNIEDDLEVSVFPNPSNGVFNLNMGENVHAALKVYNLLGECVYRQSIAVSNAEIDLKSQPNGFYFLQITPAQSSKGTFNLKYPLVISK
jgi:hypothetical protein